MAKEGNAINAVPQKRVLHFECSAHFVYAAYDCERCCCLSHARRSCLANGNWNGTMFGIMSATRINNSARSISVPGHVPGYDGDVARNPMYGTSNSKQLLAPGMH